MELFSTAVFALDVSIIIVMMSVLAWREGKWWGVALRARAAREQGTFKMRRRKRAGDEA